MKTLRAAAAASCLALFAAAPFSAQASVLVAAGDEWMLSNYGYQAAYVSGTEHYVADIATTFGGTNYLLLTGNGIVPGTLLTSLAAQLTALGKTVSYSNTFSQAIATPYDAVFHFGQAIDGAQLAAYIAGGGDAYVSLGSGVYGSAAAEAAAWNPTLAQFGLVAGDSWGPATNFVTAHVTTGPPGATALIWGYGQTIDKLTPASTSVSYLRGTFDGDPNIYGLVGASQALGVASVPEPAIWALLIGGFGLTGAMLRRRRGAATLA